MTWELAGLLAAACSLFSLGFLLCAVVTAPLLREGEGVPEHLDLDALRKPGETLVAWGSFTESRHLTLVPPPAPVHRRRGTRLAGGCVSDPFVVRAPSPDVSVGPEESGGLLGRLGAEGAPSFLIYAGVSE